MSNAQQASKQSRTKAARTPNERLKAQRLKKNWTQVYVATMIGTSDVEVSRWENGVTEPTLYFREKLCELFEQTPEALGFVSNAAAPSQQRPIGASSPPPLPLTSLIGREQEVVELCMLLRRSTTRLLTLTGTGGVGKTRLALQVAHEMQEDFTDGICFVSLASLHDAAFVLPTIARALGLQESVARSPLGQLKMALSGHHLLLVLDNFEQVVDAAPPLMDLLASCPRLRLLVTSRERLRVRGEREFVVQPLAVPDPVPLADKEKLLRTGAVALFVERAREIIPDVAFTDEDLPLIAEICRRVDGLPLAIELAAARLKLLPLSALLERMTQRLAVLTGGARDLPERQQTLRNTIAWSYELLSEREQRLFRRLAVFVGGCTLEAVEALSAMLDGCKPADILDEITSLLDKHLLSQERREGQERRLRMLETIREYGLECLAACDELEPTRRAHAHYYLHLAEEAEAHLFGAEQGDWFDQLEQERGNLRAAFDWSMEPAGEEEMVQRGAIALRLAGALIRFLTVRGPELEGRILLEQALARYVSLSASVRLKAVSGAAWFAFVEGQMARATQLGEECLQVYRQAKQTMEAQHLASALNWLGWLVMLQDNQDMARFLLEESRALARDHGYKHPLASVLLFQAEAAIEQGQYAEARSLLEESLAFFREEHNKEDLAWGFLCLGYVVFAQGDEGYAAVLVEKSLHLFREMQNKVGATHALCLLGRLAMAQDEVTRARSWFEEGLVLSRALGLPEPIGYGLNQLGCIDFLQGYQSAAIARWRESLILLRQAEHNESLRLCLQQAGSVLARQGEEVWAARLWGVAEALDVASGRRSPFLLTFRRTKAEQAAYEQQVSAVRMHLGKQAFAIAWEEGRSMTPEQALVTQGKPLNA